MCECYKIGGPWISFDPDCPEHGYEARAADKEREAAAEINRKISAEIAEEHTKLLGLIASCEVDSPEAKKEMAASVMRLQKLTRPS